MVALANMQPVTIASIRAHGVRQLLIYCHGKREGDWPCHHSGTLPINHFRADEVLSDIQRRCRCTACGWRRADVRPDYSKQQAARQSVGWMMPPKWLRSCGKTRFVKGIFWMCV